MSTINSHDPLLITNPDLMRKIKSVKLFEHQEQWKPLIEQTHKPSLGKFFDDTCTQAQIEGIHKFIEEKAEQLTLELMAEYRAALQKPIDDYDNAMRMFDK